MYKQRGIGEVELMAGLITLAIMGALAVSAYSFYNKWQAEKLAFTAFKSATQAIGEAAVRTAKAKIEADRLAKEKADEDNKRDRVKLLGDIKRLRDERSASGGFLPPTAEAASCADKGPSFRAQLERALRELDQGIQVLVDEGSVAIVDLNTAKRWAQKELQ